MPQTLPISRGIRGVVFFFCCLLSFSLSAKFIVAIDPGHGGTDPGAIGATKLYEKNVTLAIAKKIEKLAKNDPLIEIQLTRTNDTYLSVARRTEVARQKKAKILISIHADAALHTQAEGASVWVLSTSRAETEMGKLLENHEKRSELLGGAGEAHANVEDVPYIHETLLELQSANARKQGYILAKDILASLGQQTRLHKRKPEYASLGVLLSPDIPSVLVEVGFITNVDEEKKLKTDQFQQKIAQGIFNGIKHYVQTYQNQNGS